MSCQHLDTQKIVIAGVRVSYKNGRQTHTKQTVYACKNCDGMWIMGFAELMREIVATLDSELNYLLHEVHKQFSELQFQLSMGSILIHKGNGDPDESGCLMIRGLNAEITILDELCSRCGNPLGAGHACLPNDIHNGSVCWSPYEVEPGGADLDGWVAHARR